MKLVVGLGNPGSQYQKTRHNVGFEVLFELAQRFGGEKPKLKFDANVVDVLIGEEKVLLVAPLTYMNESGRTVRQAMTFFQLEEADLLVICDDLNLPSGRLRLRPGGSAGGQNGLKNIIQHLGTQKFARLRIGIGSPPGRMSASDYVLGKFTAKEREELDPAILEAADGVEWWVRDGLDTAMNRVNAPANDEQPPEK